MRRRNFKHPPEFSLDAGILSIRQNFHITPIFYVFANILGGRQYFMILLDFVAVNICVYYASVAFDGKELLHCWGFPK
jgi:hypothetical protein